MRTTVKFLKALHGDSILISRETNEVSTNILIDGGPAAAFKRHPYNAGSGYLKSALDEIKDKKGFIDLVVLTHIDDDHIGGMLAAFVEDGYLSDLSKAVWFNSGELLADIFEKESLDQNNIYIEADGAKLTSVKQGIKLENHLEGLGIQTECLIKAGGVYEINGFIFKILSPNDFGLNKLLDKWDKESLTLKTSIDQNDYNLTLKEIIDNDSFQEDKAIPNGSSIAFILEFDSYKMLFLADAHPSVIVESLRGMGYSESERIKLDLVQLSHHGSKFNTSHELLSVIDCNNFIISTDGSKHSLPNKTTLARVYKYFPHSSIFFNYPELIERMFEKSERENITLKLLDANGGFSYE